MKITGNNYEIWFLDYLEGRLNQEEEEEVRQFLLQFPDLAEELENFAPALSADPGLFFPGKEQLKKEHFDDPAYFETSAIARMEEDLTATEKESLEEWLKRHPDHRQLAQQFENTRLKPDFTIGFPGKDGLKKKSTLKVVWIRMAAVAAVFLVAFYLFYREKQLPEQNIPSIVDNTIHEKADPAGTKIKAVLPSLSVTSRYLKPTIVKHPTTMVPKHQKPLVATVERRTFVTIGAMQPKIVAVHTFEQEFADLMPVGEYGIQVAASSEIQLSKYLNDKFQELKAGGNAGFLSREGLTVAGLRLFSWLPGRRLTGKKGDDGRLKSISFSTQFLAFSIPVNRQL
jgi:hypothetical protein